MITLFACPKPFVDPHIRVIQRNAIASWVALRPSPTIILFGNEDGVAETSEELGIVHFPHVARNSAGTPLVNDVFSQAEAIASCSVMCYVNADIILMDDFMEAIRQCMTLRGRWMMGGRPWDLAIDHPLTCEPGWQLQLSAEARREGRLRWEGACDYFVYTKGLWDNLPPFALGRSYFDLALLRLARKRGAALVDSTDRVTAIHQSHSYAAHLSGENYTNNAEALENIRLAGGWEHIFTLKNATHRITDRGIRRSWTGTGRLWGYFSPRMHRLRSTLWYPALALTKPFRRRLGLSRDNLLNFTSLIRRYFNDVV